MATNEILTGIVLLFVGAFVVGLFSECFGSKAALVGRLMGTVVFAVIVGAPVAAVSYPLWAWVSAEPGWAGKMATLTWVAAIMIVVRHG